MPTVATVFEEIQISVDFVNDDELLYWIMNKFGSLMKAIALDAFLNDLQICDTDFNLEEAKNLINDGFENNYDETIDNLVAQTQIL